MDPPEPSSSGMIGEAPNKKRKHGDEKSTSSQRCKEWRKKQKEQDPEGYKEKERLRKQNERRQNRRRNQIESKAEMTSKGTQTDLTVSANETLLKIRYISESSDGLQLTDHPDGAGVNDVGQIVDENDGTMMGGSDIPDIDNGIAIQDNLPFESKGYQGDSGPSKEFVQSADQTDKTGKNIDPILDENDLSVTPEMEDSTANQDNQPFQPADGNQPNRTFKLPAMNSLMGNQMNYREDGPRLTDGGNISSFATSATVPQTIDQDLRVDSDISTISTFYDPSCSSEYDPEELNDLLQDSSLFRLSDTSDCKGSDNIQHTLASKTATTNSASFPTAAKTIARNRKSVFNDREMASSPKVLPGDQKHSGNGEDDSTQRINHSEERNKTDQKNNDKPYKECGQFTFFQKVKPRYKYAPICNILEYKGKVFLRFSGMPIIEEVNEEGMVGRPIEIYNSGRDIRVTGMTISQSNGAIWCACADNSVHKYCDGKCTEMFRTPYPVKSICIDSSDSTDRVCICYKLKLEVREENGTIAKEKHLSIKLRTYKGGEKLFDPTFICKDAKSRRVLVIDPKCPPILFNESLDEYEIIRSLPFLKGTEVSSRCGCFDHKGNILIGTTIGTYILSGTSLDFINTLAEESKRRVYCLTCSSKQEIWESSEDCIIKRYCVNDK